MRNKYLWSAVIAFVVSVLFMKVSFAERYFNSSDLDLGHFTKIKCGTGMDCTKTSGKLVITPNTVGQAPVDVETSATLTSAQCGRTFVNQGGAATATLPEASANLGCRFTFVVSTDATNLVIELDDNDRFEPSGLDAGDQFEANAIGESITVEAVTASVWAVVASVGDWLDGGA